MRYDNWDVILFPRDSHVPLQEFRTTCYVTPDEGFRPLPTLTCYISSLAPLTPFRISIHYWAAVSKSSALIECRRKPNQKVVYSVQVIVDGARVFRGFFDIASKWPQEIVHEKRSLSSVDHPSNHKAPCLEFPPFRPQALLEPSWHARDCSSRVRIMLSEQLIAKTASPGELDLGATNDIVCFSFQHAPKEVLEQAGISWPIQNPLYLPSAYGGANASLQASPAFPCVPIAQDSSIDVSMPSPLTHRPRTTTARPPNEDSYGRIRSQIPTGSRLAKQSNAARGNERPRLRDGFSLTFGDGYDDVGKGISLIKPTDSCSTADVAVSDYVSLASHPTKQYRPWNHDALACKQNASSTRPEHRMRKEDKQSMASLRDDQFGHGFQSISPARPNQGLPYHIGNPPCDPMARPSTSHKSYPPKMGHGTIMRHPPTASMARTSSYADLNSTLRNTTMNPKKDKIQSPDLAKEKSFPTYRPSFSSNKENRPPSQARLPTPYAWANRVPTPNPFAQRLPVFDADTPSRDLSTEYSCPSQLDQMSPFPQMEEPSLVASAHGPSVIGNLKSRKEAIAAGSPQFLERTGRHDKSLSSRSDAPNAVNTSVAKEHAKPTRSTPGSIPALAEIIDVDALDSQLDPALAIDAAKPVPFKSAHKPGMSSMDSTGRLEQQLFSALGEELGSFQETVDANGMGPELARAIGGATAQSNFDGCTMLNPSVGEFEPTVKRKRQGTLGGERDRSPLTKREKDSLGEVEETREENMARLRGD